MTFECIDSAPEVTKTARKCLGCREGCPCHWFATTSKGARDEELARFWKLHVPQDSPRLAFTWPCRVPLVTFLASWPPRPGSKWSYRHRYGPDRCRRPRCQGDS